MHLIYLHGFNSSPASQKAAQAQAYFARRQAEFTLHVPALPPEPFAAIRLVKGLVSQLRGAPVGFIGSSLGGYYSLHLHETYSAPAALVNPAVRPYELLCDYLGENTNLYTGEVYEVKAEHMEQLRVLEAQRLRVRQLFLLTQTHDEVLDYNQAVQQLYGASAWIKPFGDHAFQDFAAVLPAIDAFFSTQRGR